MDDFVNLTRDLPRMADPTNYNQTNYSSTMDEFKTGYNFNAKDNSGDQLSDTVKQIQDESEKYYGYDEEMLQKCVEDIKNYINNLENSGCGTKIKKRTLDKKESLTVCL